MGHHVGRIPQAASPVYPHFLEARYRTVLVQKVKAMRKAGLEIVGKYLPTILKEAETQGIPQRDDWVDSVTAMQQMLQAAYGPLFEEEDLEDMTQNFGMLVSQANGRELARMLAILGGTSVLEETWLEPHIKSFVTENVNLIKTIKEENLAQVGRVVMLGARGGLRHETIMKQVEKKFDVSEYRAGVIARDQVSKFNGDLSRVRQVHAGIETYYWDTSHDERVRGRPDGIYPHARPSHWIMQGLACRWDDPTVYLKNGKWVARTDAMPKEHVSQPILCRCLPRPRFDEEK